MPASLLIARALAGVPVLRHPESERPLQLAPTVRPSCVQQRVAALVADGRQLRELGMQGRQVGPGAAHGMASCHINDAPSVSHKRG